MTNNNKIIRDTARIANIPLWRIAAALTISEPTLTRWLRFPIPEEKEAKILDAIYQIEKEEN